MSEIAAIIDTLEGRIEKLFSRIDHLEKKSTSLQMQLDDSARVIRDQTNEIETLQSQYETLKIASSLLGSEDNKRETKLKINSLIREIDYCIAQLAD
ncbi:MAG: hypothetical protein ITG00_11395 [Flavobacterium sp.]|nr:hypothetical protein [Flavobacterium sp.]